MRVDRRRIRAAVRAAVTLLVGGGLLAPELPAQQGTANTLSGRVTEQGSGTPVPEAQVFIVGTTLGGRTNAEGRYTIRGVPAGQQRVRALRLGYTEQVQAVTIAAGQAATLDFALSRSAVTLTPVITTATGQEQRRVELGNSITNIQAASVAQTQSVNSVADVLNSRAPGVIVVSGNQTGFGARVRIRGQSSLNLSNDPIYIIDGVRMTSNNASSELFTGGGEPSRVGDLNPEEIENIEVVKGPSAATLYGTDAANGVIVITTKRGRAGPARWSAWAEAGVLEDRNKYPTNYSLAGHSPATPGTYRDCILTQVAAGTCVADSVRTLNIFETDSLTPLGRGSRQQYGMQVSGGTEVVRYFVSGEFEEEIGTMELPTFERGRYARSGLDLPTHVERPNALKKRSVRANLNAAITPNFDAAISTAYVNVDQRFSIESGGTVGIGSQAFGGRGYIDPTLVVGRGIGTPLNGYRAWTPAYTWEERNGQIVNRFMGSTNLNWRPTSWLQNTANLGIDFTNRQEDNLLRRDEGAPVSATYRLGFKDNIRADIRNFTMDVASTGTWRARDWLTSKTTLGAQYVAYQLDWGEAYGEDLPPGATTADAGATQAADESTVDTKTLGFFVEEQLNINDRLFLTGALRSDQNSAFGTDFQNVVYPKASLSWIASEEGFFPEIGWMDQLRFRASYGASGRQPGPNDALRSFEAVTANIKQVDRPGVVFDELGNVELKPERTTEFEAGFETRLFGSRTSLDLTFYQKRTKDALIDAIVAPSAGAAEDVRRNLAAVENRGWELLLTSQLVDREWLGVDVTINGSTNRNTVRRLGEGIPPIVDDVTQVRPGYPLFGWWSRPILGYADRDGDGIITYDADDPAASELTIGEDAVFLGHVQPRHQLAVTPAVELLGRRLRLAAMFDYRGGHKIWNDTERIRCGSRGNCVGTSKLGAPLFEQARAVAFREAGTMAGYFEDGEFVKLREVSASFTVPERFLGRLRAVRSMSINLAARNLATWTDYTGIDPELDIAASDGTEIANQFQTLGAPTTYVLRLNVGF